jgi:hypothetical protein
MKVSEAYTFGIEMINIGRLDDGIAMTAQIAITLIVGHNKNNIGFLHGHKPPTNYRFRSSLRFKM